jgi:hypothetical protein
MRLRKAATPRATAPTVSAEVAKFRGVGTDVPSEEGTVAARRSVSRRA